MAVAKKRIGEMLLEAGIIDDTQLKAALGHQRQWGVRLGQALIDLKLATEADIVRALSLKFGCEVAKLDALEPYGHEQALKLLPRDFASRNNVFPLWADSASVTVAMSDPTNLAVVDEIRFRTGRRVKVCIGGDHEVAEAVRRHYPAGGAVQAIALDLEADVGIAGEAVFDPFGGGSRDALEAFFGGGPEAAAQDPAPAQAAPVTAPPRAPARAAPPQAAQRAAPAPAAARELQGGSLELELEEQTGEHGQAGLLTPLDEASPGAEGAPPAAPQRELTLQEIAILESLDRLASGGPAQPEIVKPAQAMAALIRLLIRRRIITEIDFLDELSRR
jgi:hypothetical protein